MMMAEIRAANASLPPEMPMDSGIPISHTTRNAIPKSADAAVMLFHLGKDVKIARKVGNGSQHNGHQRHVAECKAET